MRHSAFVILVLVLAACESPADPTCVAGEARACSGPGGCAGSQLCTADGDYGACVCAAPTDAGPTPDAFVADASAPDADVPSDAGVDGGQPDVGPPDAGGPSTTMISFYSQIYASSGAPGIELEIDGTSVGGAGCDGFGDGFPGYVEDLTPGAHDFRVRNCFDRTTLRTQSLDLPAGRRSVFFYGNEGTGALGMFEIPGSRPTPPPAGSGIVRVVHVAPTRGALDLYVLPAGGALAGAPTVGGIAVGTASTFVEAPEGDHRIVLTRAGTTMVVSDLTGSVARLDTTRPTTLLVTDQGGGFLCAGAPSVNDVQPCFFEGGTELCYF
jgi:hypothetical protein